MPNPNRKHISDAAYARLVTDAMREGNLSRSEAEARIDPGLEPMPADPVAGRVVRAVAKMRNVWKGGRS